MTKPAMAPMINCNKIMPMMARGPMVNSLLIKSIKVAVRTKATGSLLPLSNSNIGRRLCFRLTPLDRKMEKTEAESVDDMVDANSMAVAKPKPAAGSVHPNTHHTTKPEVRAVRKTPMVDKTIPCTTTGLISFILVSIPPENRMMVRAMIPTLLAKAIFSN
ncbi:MAG: hypothetical protein BWY72_02331 [Bacteroidetes bacterium ADurb.Bin416]|nr:MAG: hypothetical protein BWY72_02331 [Bacteroidetes bacterium ADurb.Bin416]